MAHDLPGSKKKIDKPVLKIFEQKKEFRRSRARLPIEEKIRILVELQKIALTAHPGRQPNDRRGVWRFT